MKKIMLVLASALVFSAIGFAQKGHNQIGVAFEVGVPTGDFGTYSKTGFGGSVRGLFGIGTAGQITFTTGYTSFKFKDIDAHSSIIPLLAGYRHNFSGVFVEPQIGYGIYGAKVSGGSSSSEGAFTWAIGAGYAKNGFEGGVRYQSATKDGSTLSVVGIHVGYNCTLGATPSK